MTKLQRFRQYCRAALVFSLLFSLPVLAAPPPPRHVLVLHSYHPGYPRTDRVMAGIQEVFSTSNQDIRLHVEYLDTKRHPDPEYFSNILDAILHYKLQGRSFDLVLLTHNEALKFALTHRNDLFAGTPMIFGGVTGFDRNTLILADWPQLTGVVERPDFEGVLQLALHFDPQVEKVVVIGSTRDTSGRLEYKALQEAARRLQDRVRIVFWNDLPAESLAERLQRLHTRAAVVLFGTVFDRSGNPLSPADTCHLVRDYSQAPIYSFWDTYLGEGIVGGRLVDLAAQGRAAAVLALRVLAGEQAETLPILALPPSLPVFDDRQLKRLGIHSDLLPADSSLINEPPGFYRLSKRQGTLLLGLLAGSITLTGILSHNILQRRRAEVRLREGEQRYRQLSQQFQTILDGIPDGVTLISAEMKVLWSNQGAMDLSGIASGAEMSGESCCMFLYNRFDLCDNCPAVKTFRTGLRAEACIRTPDGRELDVKALPLRDGQGIITQVILLASNVTEKNKLREEAERSSRLASLGELVAGIAHEINNPNALILLNTSLVRKSCSDAAPILMHHYHTYGDFSLGGLKYSEMAQELPHLLAEMQEGAERIRRIVADLKDFARPESSAMKELVGLNEVTMTAVRLSATAVRQSTDRFHAAYDPDLPKFRGNFQKVEQVVVNLLLNACQALPQRDRALTVETGYQPDGQEIWLRVCDEGVGIRPEDLPHITDPFFTTKRDQGGTGLGLSVSARIVRDHGGRLEYQSQPGRGTTALLRLPAARQHLEELYEGDDESVPAIAHSAGR